MNKHKRQEERNKLRHALPGLAARVLALHHKFYEGCGYHWALERELGGLLRTINDFDTPFSNDCLLACQVNYEMLLDSVVKSEQSTRELEAKAERCSAEGTYGRCSLEKGHKGNHISRGKEHTHIWGCAFLTNPPSSGEG